MFPAPSPNTQSLLNQLQGGGATPSTLEFHRTALNAAKRSAFNVPTSNPTTEPEQLAATTMDTKTSQPAAADPFTHHDAADAANGLFMLAKGGQANMPNQNAPNLSSEPVADTKRTRNANNSISSGREMTAEGSDTQGEQSKPAARGKGKKNQPGKGAASVNGRRKAEEPAKGPNKRAKINGSIEMTPEDDSDMDDSKDDYGGKDPKKMTDEEKRKNFLERNRYVIEYIYRYRYQTNCFTGLPPSNVANGRNNGSPTCKPKSKCLQPRTMHSPLQSHSSVKKLLISRHFCLRIRTVLSPRLKASVL
jgi:ATF/CREB family transcription factor